MKIHWIIAIYGVIAFLLADVFAEEADKQQAVSNEQKADSGFSIDQLKDQAEQGDTVAQYRLARMYLRGNGVPQDVGEAFRWVAKSAEQGYAEGQNGLGFLYANGIGVEQDNEQAFVWFKLAAEQGLMKAQGSVAGMYLNGIGIQQDYGEAYRWYTIAAAKGNKEAKESALALEAMLSEEELAEAKALADAWLNEHPVGE